MEGMRSCRLCAKAADDPVSIFSCEESEISYDDIIAKYLSIKVRVQGVVLEMIAKCLL